MSAEWLNGCVYKQNGPGDALRWPDACADEGSGLDAQQNWKWENPFRHPPKPVELSGP